tara:strand:+ start:193 stop:390 length:198 start_codon:yes stop_codon:yes gene_type:complete
MLDVIRAAGPINKGMWVLRQNSVKLLLGQKKGGSDAVRATRHGGWGEGGKEHGPRTTDRVYREAS